MRYQFPVFISIVVSVLCLGSYYIASRWITKIPQAKTYSSLIWFGAIFFILIQILGPLLYRTFPNQQNKTFIFHWIVYASLGLFACLFLYTLGIDLILMTWKWIFRPQNSFDIERRSFLGVSALAFGSSALGAIQAHQGPKVEHVDIHLPQMPDALEGFKILQITDLHVGPIIDKKIVETVVQIAESLDADLIALTGDFVDGSVESLSEQMEPLKKLRAKHGLWFVTGNHEYYWGVLKWIDWFKSWGVRTLLNEHVVIEHRGAKLVIAGVTDLMAHRFDPQHRSDPKKSIQGAPENEVKILLAHQPESYLEACPAGFDLQLSGHTHGGQFFPFSILVSLAHKYYRGLHKIDKMWLYISRGTGFWGPPMRFAVPCEMTLLSLKKNVE